jgi:uncharacterized protein YqjF (DUF2071 family)
MLRMRWLDLLFAHWPVDLEAIARLLPDGLELDTFDGRAWLGIVPFTMADVAPRGLPAVPRFSRFPEVNVRTYVRHRGSPGVFFLSLDCASSPTVSGARWFFHLPYFRAVMSSQRNGDDVDYRSNRADQRGQPAAIEARYRPMGPVKVAMPGSFEAWSTDRMRLFAADRAGRLWRTRIAHGPWPLQRARADFATNTMALAAGIVLPNEAPHLRFARRLDVRGFPPERLTATADPGS